MNLAKSKGNTADVCGHINKFTEGNYIRTRAVILLTMHKRA